MNRSFFSNKIIAFLSVSRNFILVLSTIIFVFLPFFIQTSEASNYQHEKVVRIGCFDYGQMMKNLTGSNVHKSGYAYEYLQEIAVHTGWHYEYVAGTFKEVMDMLCRGEVDMVPMISRTEERQQKIFYPDQPFGMEYFFLVTTNDRINDFRNVDTDLQGKKIGVDAGYAENKFLYAYLEEHNIAAEIISYPTTTKKDRALRNKEVDIVLYSNNTLPQDLILIQSMGSMPCYIGISLSRPDILSEMNAAVTAINLNQPGYTSHLMEKYFFNTPMNRQLSSDEIVWLEKHPVIKIGGFSDDFPYCYTDKNGNIAGVNVEVVKLMLERLNISNQVEWILFDDRQQANNALRNNSIDIICPEYHDYYDADERDILVSHTFNSLIMGALCKGFPDKNGMNTIATPEAKLGIAYIKNNYPGSKVIPCETVSECIEKVYQGEATAAVAPMAVLEQAIGQAAAVNEYKIIPLSAGCDVCFSARHNENLLIKIMNRGIHFVPKDEIDYLTMQFTLRERKPLSAFDFFKQHPEYPIIFLVLVCSLIITAYALQHSNRSEKELSLANAQIKQTNDHLESLVAERTAALENALAQAEAASKSKTTFLFNMSHDIRTPMNAILGFNKMAEKYIDSKEQLLDCLRKVENAGQHLLSLINQILEMARIESGKLEIEEKRINLLNCKGTTTAMVDSLAEAKNISLTKNYINIDKDLYLWLDNVRVDQVLINILSNAIKYTPNGGTVNYTLELLPGEDDDHVKLRFTIADNGIGMSKEFMETIFDNFSRERNSTVSGIQGAGLGMAIVKRIIDAMNGQINVTSELGKGTTIWFELNPRIASAGSVDNVTTAITEKEVSLKGLKVLLVEDNELNREIAKEILSDFGMTVDEAEDGTIAVNKLTKAEPGQYDIVLMDIQMPIMDGYRATIEIRHLPNPDIANIPIIAMTANAFSEDKKKAMDVGMNGHLAKPVDINKLKEALSMFTK